MEQLIIFGYGSVGSFIHQNLKKVDNIHIFSSKNSNELLGSSKLSYQKIDGKKKNVNCKSIGIIPDTPFNVILCCKSYSISKFVSQFSSNKNLIRVISIQNGIGHIKKLERIGVDRIIIGNISNVSISRSRNTFIHHSGRGCLNLDKRFEKDKYLIRLLENFKLEKKFFNYKKLIWGKLVRLNVISLVTSYKFRTLGDILKSKKSREELKDVLSETLNIAKSDGYSGKFNEEFKLIEELPNKFRSSMALDFKRKRKTEIDDITGEIIKIAKKNDIPYESINYFYRKLTSQRF